MLLEISKVTLGKFLDICNDKCRTNIPKIHFDNRYKENEETIVVHVTKIVSCMGIDKVTCLEVIYVVILCRTTGNDIEIL